MMMIERPAVTVSTPAGDITLTAYFNGDAVPLVSARFERLTVSRVPYKGSVQARRGAAGPTSCSRIRPGSSASACARSSWT